MQGGGRAGSRGAETARFMSALRRQAEREGRCVFSSAELYSLANELSLAVRDVAAFVDQLNESGRWLGRVKRAWWVGTGKEGCGFRCNAG